MFRRFRRSAGLGLVLLGALLAGAPTASAAPVAQQTVVWDLTSRYVTKQDALAGMFGINILRAGPTGLRSWVVLPEGYTPERCWPVLYLLHGSQAPSEWAGVAPLVKGLPAIVVAPGGGDSVYTNWYNNGRRAPRWEDWFFKELMPLVNRSFNVCGGRQDHSIAGTSMGGYGALYLASQRPDYFGSAGSFSGIIALTEPVLQIGFGLFRPVWGPPNGWYANGHDPVVLAPNLRDTRVYVGQGNGTPVDAHDDDPSILTTVEQSTAVMGRTWLRAARKAKVPVTYDLHAGIHTSPNFDMSLRRMLGWGPFGPAAAAPAAWTFRTVNREADAWGYHVRFAKAPTTVVELRRTADGALTMQGAGRVTITAPDGAAFTATLPFTRTDGRTRAIPRRAVFSNGRSAKLPVGLGLRPWHPRLGQPVEVRFKTDRVLKKGETYAIEARQQTIGCYVDALALSTERRKGRWVYATLKPGVGKGHPDHRWCTGNGHVSLLIASTGRSTSLSDIKLQYLGEATFAAAKRR